MIIDAAELRRRYLLRIAGARNEKVYIGPRIVALNIIGSCNLRCQFCCSIYAPGNPRHLEKISFLSWEKFVEIVRDCVDLKVDQIDIVGGGEPAGHPLFRDIMRHLDQQPLKVRILTNGTFPLDYCSDVMKADQVKINIGAVDSQQYLDLHGKDFFNHVMANIKRLVSLRDSEKPEFLIDIAFVVNAVNINQKQQMQDLAHRLGIHKVHFIDMIVTQYNKEIALPRNLLKHKEKKSLSVCLNGWFRIRVTVDRGLSICCEILRMFDSNLDKEPFKSIWLSPHMMELRLLGKYGEIQKKYKACQDCPDFDENVRRLQDLERFKKK